MQYAKTIPELARHGSQQCINDFKTSLSWKFQTKSGDSNWSMVNLVMTLTDGKVSRGKSLPS